MEGDPELGEAVIVVPSRLNFKKIQYKPLRSTRRDNLEAGGNTSSRFLQAENLHDFPPDLPNYVNIESPPSTQPCKRICDITGYEAPYVDPRTNLRYANANVFKTSQVTFFRPSSAVSLHPQCCCCS